MTKETPKELTKRTNEVTNRFTIATWESPDISTTTNYAKAKPILESAKTAIEEANEQTQMLFAKIGKIATNCDNKIKSIEEKLKEENEEKNKLKKENDQLRQEIQSINEENQNKIINLNEDFDKEKAQVTEAQESEIKGIKLRHEQEVKSHKDELQKAREQHEAIIEEYLERINLLNELNKKLKEKESKLESNIQTLERINSKYKNGGERNSNYAESENDIMSIPEEYKSRERLCTSNDIQTFSGENQESVVEWLFYTNRIVEMSNFNEHEKTFVVTKHLRGLAKQEYMLYEQSNGRLPWKRFMEFIKERFLPENQADILLSQIKKLKQTNTIKEYYIEFKKLANQLTQMPEEFKTNFFIDGLKPSTAAWVKFSKAISLEDAYKTAIRVETFGMQDATIKREQNIKCAYCQRVRHNIEECRTKAKKDRFANYQKAQDEQTQVQAQNQQTKQTQAQTNTNQAQQKQQNRNN